MKLPIIKLLSVLFLLFFVGTVAATRVYATSPIVTGQVQVKGTNAPIVGVWVKWTDSTKHIRYTQTDSNGQFSFASWQAMSQSERDTEHTTHIDTNLDGTNDALMADTSDSIYFGCVQSPHEFTAIVPASKNYTFSTVKFSYANIGHKITIPPIIENPPPVACGVSCSTPADCQSAKDGCTTCTGGKCTAPPTPSPAPACGVACTKPTDCQNAKDGCTSCTGGKCVAPPPACGVACTKPTDCQSAKDGCTTCTGGKCTAPVPACGVSCSTPADCQSAKDGCTTCTGGKCTAPVPACGVSCSTPADCQSAKDGCTTCTGGKCTAPVPACGVSCSTPADCQSAKDGCTTCSNGVCSASPVSPTPVAACGVACTKPTDCQSAKDGCTSCTGGVCAAPPPAFNPASCTCDGIDYSGIFSGQNTTITSYSKVIGSDVSSAQVVGEKFFLAEGAEDIATIIASSDAIPASVIVNTPSLVRYQTQWQLTMPQLIPNATYRLWSQIDCQPKTSAYNYSSPKRVVLGSQTQQTSFIGGIWSFLSNLFGFSSNSSNNNIPSSTPTPTPSNQTNKTLQLKTLTPASVYQKTCSFIKFKVSGLQ